MCSKQENAETNADIITAISSDNAIETTTEISETTDGDTEEIHSETNFENEDMGVCSSVKCLNCGTELNGEYCHNCGQHITAHTMTVKGFLLDYVDNAFFWDVHHIKTLRLLVGRPGFLTKEYISGRLVSQVQPLKLNMFLMVVFLTLFVFFASDQYINNAMQEITNNEIVFATWQMDAISNDADYIEKINASPRDTVDLIAPIFLTEKYPDIISAHDVKYNVEGEAYDQWVAIVPHVLIEEEIFSLDDDGCYRFNTEVGVAADEQAMAKTLWEQLSSITMQYFPVIMLLTAPLLALSLSLVHRKRKRSYFTHFIFSMHYIAFVLLSTIVLYLVYLIAHPSLSILNHVFAICSCIYFTRAFHLVYGTTWFRSITKAILSNVIYYSICMLIFFMVFFITVIVVAINYVE